MWSFFSVIIRKLFNITESKNEKSIFLFCIIAVPQNFNKNLYTQLPIHYQTNCCYKIFKFHGNIGSRQWNQRIQPTPWCRSWINSKKIYIKNWNKFLLYYLLIPTADVGRIMFLTESLIMESIFNFWFHFNAISLLISRFTRIF